MVIVLMGPAGAGKSTVGVALSQQLRWSFVEADDYHTSDNKARMKRGVPLTEAERLDWLTALRAIVARALDRREPLVLRVPPWPLGIGRISLAAFGQSG